MLVRVLAALFNTLPEPCLNLFSPNPSLLRTQCSTSLCAADQDVVYWDVYCTPRQPFAPPSFSSFPRRHIIPVLEKPFRVYILSLTTYPITPMIKKPIPTAWEMRRNSRRSAVSSVSSYSSRTFPLSRPRLSGSSGGGGRRRFGNVRLEHRVINCLPSLRNSRGISRSSFVWSIVAVVLRLVAAEW